MIQTKTAFYDGNEKTSHKRFDSISEYNNWTFVVLLDFEFLTKLYRKIFNFAFDSFLPPYSGRISFPVVIIERSSSCDDKLFSTVRDS